MQLTDASNPTTATDPDRPALRLPVLLLMSVAAGLSASAMYLSQPILDVLRDYFSVSAATAGLTVTLGAIGYAAGLALIVPLGDRLSKRRLASALLVATAAFLVVTSTAPSPPVLLIGTALAAVTAVGAQVLVPLTNELSTPGSQSRNVGIVMAGVVLGGLVGRAVSGVLADALGWRAVYWIVAGALCLVAALVMAVLPDPPADRDRTAHSTVGGYLRATFGLLARLPMLGRTIAIAASVMASFAIHFTALTFLLAGAPYYWPPTTIGLFSLLGAVGALSMPFVGRVVDRGHPRTVVTVGIGLVALGWVALIPAGSGSLGWLVAGIVLINLGQPAILNATQSAAYALEPDARSRINAVYMPLFFVAGAIGTVIGTAAWSRLSWAGLCGLGVLLATVAALALRRWRP